MQAEPVREPDRDSRRLHHPHDSLFKALLEEPARVSDLLRKHLPVGIRELLADAPPVLADGIFVDGDLAGSQSDRVFRLALREECEHEYFYVILEHKSRTDPGTALKAVGYATRILEREAAGGARKLRNLPPVIVLVLYHGRAVWNAPVSLEALFRADKPFRPYLPGLLCIVRDLGRMRAEELADDPGLRAGLLAACRSFRGPLEAGDVAEIMLGLPGDSRLEEQVVRYMVDTFNIGRAVLKEGLRGAGPERMERLMRTVGEELRAEGKGIGLAEGRAEMLLRLMRRCFGTVSSDAEAKVRTAGISDLDAWADAILDAESVDDLLWGQRSN